MNEALVRNKKKKVDTAFKIITKDAVIICSSDHKWLIEGGKWKSKVDGLKKGNKIKLVNSYIQEQETKQGYSEILSMECIGQRELYDIQTSTENFIANGLISHNCYMKAFPQKELRLDEKEFKVNLGENNLIFVGSSIDMFAKNIHGFWIEKVLDYCRKYDNTYLFQSKNPTRFYDFIFPNKTILGTTIETNREYNLSQAPDVFERATAMNVLASTSKYEIMVTIEPIVDFDLNELIELIKFACPNWVNIGADSKGHNLPEPSLSKLNELINRLKEFVIVKQKNNLNRLN